MTDILEEYGIGSETDVSELQDDFIKMTLKPLDAKKLKHCVVHMPRKC